jgi:hypothetical protein
MMSKTFVELLAQKHHEDYADHFLPERLQGPSISENAIEVTGLKHDGSTIPVDLTNKLPHSKLSRLGSPPTSWEWGILLS